MELFKINSHGVIDITPELLMIKEFKALYRRLVPSKGDADGRKKLLNIKELSALWYMADYNSPIVKQGLGERESILETINNFDLEEDWKPDAVFKEALERYKKDYADTPAIKLVKSLLKSFNGADSVVNELTELNNKLLRKISTLDLDDSANVELSSSLVTLLVSNQTKLLEISTKVPSQIKSLKDALEMLKEESEEVELLRGKEGAVLSSMNRSDGM